MANEVDILLKATDQTSGAVKSATSSLSGLDSTVQNISVSWTEFNSGLEVGNKAIQVAKGIYDETAGAAMAYDEEIRKLTVTSGESAENTSRFVQVLDDWQISADDVMTATKALTKEGLAPNIETLAKLSDQYLTITDAEDRNAFVLKNLGKAGLEWTQVLQQGGAALREQAAAVDANLIVTEQQIAAAEKSRLAMDDFNDSVDGAKIKIGNEMLPVLGDLVTAFSDSSTAATDNVQWWEKLFPPIGAVHTAIIAVTEAFGGNKDATKEMSYQHEVGASIMRQITSAEQAAIPTEKELAEAKKAAAEAAQALTEKYQSLLAMTQSIASQENAYTKTSLELTKQREAAAQALVEAQKKPWDTKSIDDAKNKLGEVDAKISETAKNYQAQTAQIIYANLMTKLSVGGITDAEFAMAQQAGVSLGIFTQAQANQAIAINNMTTQVANGTLAVDALGKAIDMLPSGKTIDVIANILAGVAAGNVAPSQEEIMRQRAAQGHAAGTGPGGTSGGLTWVGETGRELVNLPQGSQVTSSPQARNDNAALIAAIYANRIDVESLARALGRVLGNKMQAAGLSA